MKVLDAADIIGAKTHDPDLEFTAINIDSRHIKPGQLFVAIIGDCFDGHDFVEAAEKQGAVAAIVSKPMNTSLPCLEVSDTRKALAQLASHHRDQMLATVMGVTGSCGKTTTKALLASILSQHGNTLSSVASFNNDIGVPLTLLSMTPSHQYAVCEMGANHPGEIAMLTQLVKPDVAAITNAGPAHLEGFVDVRGVACAKGEIFQGLGSDGAAVINADDEYANFWKKQVKGHRILTFGRDNDADVMATRVELDGQAKPSFQLSLPNGTVDIQLQLMGEHNVMNALTAATMAHASGVPIAAIKMGLEAAMSPNRRLIVKKGLAGATVINDTYNANPSSASAAMSVLVKRGGDSIFVLGDMLELGEHTEQWHRQIGMQADQLGIHRLYCYGEHSRHAAKAFGENAYYFKDRDALLLSLRDCLHEDTTVLVKGSKAMGMDKIVQALTEE